MDVFRSLTVGASFSEGRNQAAMDLYRKKQKQQKNASGNNTAGGVIRDIGIADFGASGGSTEALIASPRPCASLDIVGSLGGADSSHATQQATQVGHEDGADHQDKPLKAMTYKKKKNIWRKHDMQVSGEDLPAPIEHFSDLVRPPLNCPRHVVNNLFRRDHKIPTAIQCQSIPSLIQRRDVLSCAPTGSGKTVAFLVPMFALLQKPDPQAGGIRALIVTPTVELAQQIEREAFFLMKGQRWRFVQHGQTTKDKDIFISTPGRIISLLQKKLLTLAQVQFLVFDEGDRLWDPKTDFIQSIDGILSACTRADKVVSLFTATLSERIETAARSVMSSDPVRIIVRGRQTANTHVKQRLLFCGNELGKIVAMRNIIRDGIKPPVLIFVQSIERTKELYDEIRTQGLHIAVMNAKMSVEEREEVVLQFRLGKIWVLVTTELLSRGIDFKNIGTVINFDFPATVDSYIHRVGRTGRAGHEGEAVTFFTEEDRDRLPGVAKVIRDSGSEVEDWMLDIRVDRSTRRRLDRSTPHRAIVSTNKRILVAGDRIRRQYRRMEKDQENKKGKKSTEEDGSENDFSDED